jgi:hypothetical protein
MKNDYNYIMHRGWDIEEFDVNGETHYRAIKNGTTIANPDLNTLVDILDSIDFPQSLRYNN